MRSAKSVVSEKLARIGTAAKMSTTQRQPPYTVTALKRWSVGTNTPPGRLRILVYSETELRLILLDGRSCVSNSIYPCL